MNGHDAATLVEFVLVFLGFVFRKSEADQGASESGGRGAGGRAGQYRPESPAGDDGADAWQNTRNDAHTPNRPQTGSACRARTCPNRRVGATVLQGGRSDHFVLPCCDANVVLAEPHSPQFGYRALSLARIVKHSNHSCWFAHCWCHGTTPPRCAIDGQTIDNVRLARTMPTANCFEPGDQRYEPNRISPAPRTTFVARVAVAAIHPQSARIFRGMLAPVRRAVYHSLGSLRNRGDADGWR